MATSKKPVQRMETELVTRAEGWEARSSWPLLLLSLAFVGLTTLGLADYDLNRQANMIASIGLVVLWIIFIADFLIRLSLTSQRWRYVRQHWFEAISLILPILRAFLLVLYLWRLPVFRRSRNLQRLRFMLVAASFGFVFVYVAATLVWIVEHREPGANILTFGEAMWWGFVTITTVGYGDYTPITPTGRVIAVGLMLGGIVIVGIVSATVISALTDQLHRGVAAAPAGARTVAAIAEADEEIEAAEAAEGRDDDDDDGDDGRDDGRGPVSSSRTSAQAGAPKTSPRSSAT